MGYSESNVGLPIAFQTAYSFKKTGDSLYTKLNKRHKESKKHHIGDIVACATNYTLSIEILLKVLVAQYKSAFPRGHKLNLLFEELPPKIQDSLTNRYKSFLEAHTPSNDLANIKISFNNNDEEKDDSNFSIDDHIELLQILTEYKSTFINSRYWYELDPDKEKEFRFNFPLIGYLLKSLFSEIKSTNSTHTYKLTENDK